MLDFNPVTSFGQYLELQMSDWKVLYMDKKLRKRPTTFMLNSKPSSAFKGFKSCLKVKNVFLAESDLYPLI